MALVEFLKENRWLRTLLKEMGFGVNSPTPVGVDNSAAIVISRTKTSKRNRHYDASWFFWIESVEQGEAVIHKVMTDANQSDFGTKKLSRAKFVQFRDEIIGGDASQNHFK